MGMTADFTNDGVRAPERHEIASRLSAEQWSADQKGLPNRSVEAKSTQIALLGNLTITDNQQKPAGKKSDDAAAGHHLAEIAGNFAGQQLWRHSKYEALTVNGKYGCAASVSLVLKGAGYKYADSPTVGGLVGQLTRHGWTQHPASEAREGDLMVGYEGSNWQKGGGNAHVGIVTADGRVYNNSKRQQATWAAEAPNVAFEDYSGRYVLRPPQKGR
jgi:hypothetical protein